MISADRSLHRLRGATHYGMKMKPKSTLTACNDANERSDAEMNRKSVQECGSHMEAQHIFPYNLCSFLTVSYDPSQNHSLSFSVLQRSYIVVMLS